MPTPRRSITTTPDDSTSKTVWVFFAITLMASAFIVYLIGHRLDNPDGAILAVLVPSAVAIAMTARATGWAGVRSLLRLRGEGPGSVRLFLAAALAIPALALAAITIGSVVTGESYDFAMPSEGVFVLLPLAIIVVGEEYGWRGFVLPRLQGRYSALVASLIVGVAWWMWHYPPSLIGTGVPLDTPFWLFGVFVLAMSVLMTSVFNASKGSVGLVMLFHLASNAAFVFLPLLPENRGGDLTTFSIFVALAVVAAATAVRIGGPGSLVPGRLDQAKDRPRRSGTMMTPARIALTATFLGIAVFAAACSPAETQGEADPGDAPQTTTTVVTGERAELATLLENLIAGTDLPSLGVTVFDGETIIETAVTGVRRSGDPTPVEVDDKFSIGSNAKAMTATLVATFVDEDVLTWETTLDDAFGDVVPNIDESWEQVTLRQLLSHTAGLNDAVASGPVEQVNANLPMIEQRSKAAAVTLTRPAQHPVGQHMYSNVGYTLVGAMLEELTGTSWEDLLQTRVLDVLGMESCGFYAPGTPGEVDQPWGHFDQRGGEAVDPGHPDAELPHVIAPAGLVHCSMADWAVFLQSQLRGFAGSDAEIISQDGFRALQTPAEGTDYALGWEKAQTPIGTVISHNGSNLRFMSHAGLVPGEGFGVLVVTNLGLGLAEPTVNATLDAMVERHFSLDPSTATDADATGK